MADNRDVGNSENLPNHESEESFASPLARPAALEKESKKWGFNPDTLMVIFTGLLMFIGVYTALIFFGQFQEMINQTDLANIAARQARKDSADASAKVERQLAIAQQQADAAAKQSITQKKQLEITSAAILRVDNMGTEGPEFPDYKLYINLFNSGQTSATDIRGSLIITLKAIPSNTMIGKPRVLPIRMSNIPAYTERNQHNFGDWVRSDILTPQDIKLIATSKAAIVSNFSFSYNNGFKIVRDPGEYCNAFMGFPKITRVSRANPREVETMGGFSSYQCGQLPERMATLVENIAKAQQWRAQDPDKKPN